MLSQYPFTQHSVGEIEHVANLDRLCYCHVILVIVILSPCILWSGQCGKRKIVVAKYDIDKILIIRQVNVCQIIVGEVELLQILIFCQINLSQAVTGCKEIHQASVGRDVKLLQFGLRALSVGIELLEKLQVAQVYLFDIRVADIKDCEKAVIADVKRAYVCTIKRESLQFRTSRWVNTLQSLAGISIEDDELGIVGDVQLGIDITCLTDGEMLDVRHAGAELHRALVKWIVCHGEILQCGLLCKVKGLQFVMVKIEIIEILHLCHLEL